LAFRTKPRPPRYFWHNIGNSDERWWTFLKEKGLITAGFRNEPGDAGERLLRSYVHGDTIIAYASGRGAIGWGVIENPKYQLVPADHDEEAKRGWHRHRLNVSWRCVAPNLTGTFSARKIRQDFGIHHPIRTSISIKDELAKNLIEALNAEFGTLSTG
jgi:hypothetical protein